MSKPARGFYAVRRGRTTGVFMSWDECEAQIRAYKGAVYKKFSNAAAAEEFVNGSTTSNATSSRAESGGIDGQSKTATTSTFADKGKKRARSSDVEDESGWDVVYCDGACKGNGQPGSVAGIGVWWGRNDPRNIAERCPGGQTNNRAELIAILRILETTPITKKPILIKSDSQYSINCFKLWIKNWRANNFRSTSGAPVKNASLIRYIAAHLDARTTRSQQVILQHVKGHNGEEGNEGADELANKGAAMPTLPERDWEELQRTLEAKSQTDPAKVVPKAGGKDEVEFEVEVSPAKTVDPPREVTKFYPNKMVKGNSGNPLPDKPSNPQSKPLAKIRSPKAVVRADEVDFDKYANGKMWDEAPRVVGMKQVQRTEQSKKTTENLVADIPKSNGVPTFANADEIDLDLDMYADGLLSDDDFKKLKF